MVDDGFAIAFQMTTKADHDVKTSGMDDLQTYVGKMPVCFILLVPKGRETHDTKLAVPAECHRKAHVSSRCQCLSLKTFLYVQL